MPSQLYTPFFDDGYKSKYPMFENTKFKRTKVVVPNASYAFFGDLFDLGKAQTSGHFNTYHPIQSQARTSLPTSLGAACLAPPCSPPLAPRASRASRASLLTSRGATW